MDEGLSTYLGMAERSTTDSYGTSISSLIPTHRWNTTTKTWGPILDRLADFPERGTVIWIDADTSATPGSLWLFTSKPNPRSAQGNHFMVHQAERAIEILDLRKFNSEQARKTMTVTGVDLDWIPTPNVYLHVGTQLCLGPVPLRRMTDAVWGLTEEAIQKPLAIIEPPKGEFEARIDGQKRVILPFPKRVVRASRQFDWSSDRDLLARTLELARQITPQTWKNLDLSKRTIDDMLETLPIPDDESTFDLQRQRLHRATKILESVEFTTEQAKAFAGQIQDLPAVTTALDERQRAILAAAEEAAAAIRQTAQGEHDRIIQEATDQANRLIHDAQASGAQFLTTATEQVSKLAQQRTERAIELDALNQEIAAKRTALIDQFRDVDTELDARIAEILSRPERMLVDSAIFRAIGRAAGHPTPPATHSQLATPLSGYHPTPVTRQTRWHNPSAAARVFTRDDVSKHLRSAFSRLGVPPRLGLSVHACLLAGALPVLAGARARDALTDYASVVAGGRMVTVPVTPTILEPGDLIGRYDSNSGRFLPHSAGLADILLDAAQIDDLVVVVFEGINRAPSESFLLPILHAARTGHPFQIAHAGILDPLDPYAGLAQVIWPRNILVTATVVDGLATLPLPPSLWSQAALIHLDCPRPKGEPSISKLAQAEKPDASGLGSVPLNQWVAWQTDSSALNDDVTAILDDLLSGGFPIGRDPIVLTARLEAHISAWLPSGNDEEFEALNRATEHVIVPSACATGCIEDVLPWLEERQLTTDRVRTLIAYAGSVLGR